MDALTPILQSARTKSLRAAMAVAEQGSTAAAARVLHCSQPVVARAVSELEALLGQALFERGSRGMRPTAAGDRVVARARRALQHLEQVLSHEGAHNVAAIVLEPMTGSSGMVIYPEGYLQGVRALCDRHGILLVYDEVMTGFGRTGAAFAATRLGVLPDLMSFAKGASSSYTPLGGVLVREGVASHFDTELFDVGHTHAGHVLAVAGGVAALRVYLEEGLFERALEIEGWLREGLGELQRRHPVVGDAARDALDPRMKQREGK